MVYAEDVLSTATRSSNRLLDALVESEDFKAFRPHVQSVEVGLGEVLARSGERAAFVYFPETAVISVVASSGDGATVEVAMVGSEGVAGSFALINDQPVPYMLIANFPGTVVRLPAEVGRQAMAQSPALARLVYAQMQGVITQVTQSAVCSRFHSPRQRLAKWLALTCDRANTQKIPLTHESISNFVGGARSMVTQASNELRQMGVVEYRRGSVTVLDPEKLRAESCECYRVVTDALRK